MSAPPAVRGHAIRQHGAADWRCSCGARLSGGPLGNGRMGARDVMRFHRAGLWMATPAAQAALAATLAGTRQEGPPARAGVSWVIWGRANGKTRRLLRWWLEDPEGRVILTATALLAENARERALEMLDRGDYPGGQVAIRLTPAWKELADRNIMSAEAWRHRQRSRQHALDYVMKAVALDDVEAVIDHLVQMPRGSRVEVITATGFPEPRPRDLVWHPRFSPAVTPMEAWT